MMYAKIQIKGKIEVVTGMHIGGSSAFSAIGAVDSPVMKDSRTNLPLLPGSSLKGKMRTLLAKSYNKEWVENRDYDDERILRLFGSTKKNAVRRGRLLFSDMALENAQKLRELGVNSLTEVKFENNISRTTAVAMPRQIERVIRGAEFGLDMIYDAEEENELVEDFRVLSDGIRLLQYDYIGGHGSRGYGKIRFHELKTEVVVGDIKEDLLNQCQKCLDEVVYAE